MSKPGPKPIPTAALKLHGGYRARRHAGRFDGKPVSGSPVKPADLDAAGGELWDQITKEHKSRGTLGEIDSAALCSLCEVWTLYRRCLELAKADPADKNARCSVLAYLSQCDRLGAKFGWTSSDRASMKLGETAPPPDGVAAFARRRGS